MASFADASAVSAIDCHTYSVHFPDEWCIGTVPHGGFVTSVFQRVATLHFKTTLSHQHQPHTLALHLEFLRRTQQGHGLFKVRDVKLGRQTSVIHLSLIQDSREEVVGYITHANLHTEKGPSFPTGWTLQPPSYTADVKALREGRDVNWAEQKEMPFAAFRKASNRVRFFLPRKGQLTKSLSDEWITFRNEGDRFTQDSLGFVADMWPQIVEVYRTSDDPNDPVPDEASKQIYSSSTAQQEKDRVNRGAPYWYPTVLLNLDVKKALPEEGVEWLFVRMRSKQIKNGRLDIEVVINDEDGDLVALSHHVTLVVGSERNTAKRRQVDTDGSKL